MLLFLQAWVTGVFFCFGAMAWLIRALLLALVKTLTWIKPSPTPQQEGRRTDQRGGRGASRTAAGSSFSLFSNSSSNGNSSASGSQQPQQLLPDCARAVPPSPRQQLGAPDGIVRVYGPPVSYADAVAHRAQGAVSNGDGAGVEQSPRRSAGSKSPAKAGGQGGSSSSSTPGRVRFADDI